MARLGIALAALYVTARATAATALGAATSPDSIYYLRLDWSGRGRPWTVPAFYTALPDDRVRVLAQAAVAAAAWVFAAWVLARLVRPVPAKAVVAASVLAVGTSPAITYWDRVIYSEALSVSLAVAAAAAVLQWASDRRWPWLAMATAAAGLWTHTRPTNAVVASVLVVGLAGWALRRREAAVAAVVLLAAVGGALAQSSRNEGGVAIGDARLRAELGRDDIDTLTPNLLGIVQTRVLGHPDREAWFRRHHLPEPDPAHPNLLTDPRMRGWVDEHAGAYPRYLASHPGYTLSAPLPSLEVLLAPKDFADTNTDDHRVPAFTTPAAAADLLSSLRLLGVAVVAGAVATAFALRRRRAGAALAGAWVLLATSVPHLLVVWHGSTAELARLSVTNAALTRLGAIAVLAAVSAQVAPRSRNPTSGLAAPSSQATASA